MPDKAQLYDHISTDFCRLAVANSRNSQKQSIHTLTKYYGAFLEKRPKPFEALRAIESFISAEVSLPDIEIGTKALASMNSLVAQHNTESENFQKTMNQARKDS